MEYTQKNSTICPFKHILIIGGGLIGSSIAHATKANWLDTKISIFDKNPNARAELEQLDLGEICNSLVEGCQSADLIMICTPVGTMANIATQIAPHLKPDTCVSDVGSVKHHVSDALRDILPNHIHLIPGHPIAGTEHSGPKAGFAELFQDAWHILCPFDDTNPIYLEKLSQFWRRLGAKVDTMTASQHDRILAVTSHIPHLIAFNIVGTASDMETVDTGEVVKYSASGFRDFTRIAASDPIMWRDIFLNNKDAVLEVLGRFTEDLIALQRAIRWDDAAYIEEKISHAKSIRQDILGQGLGHFTTKPKTEPEKKT